ncbi:hypothetical protein DPEC_G00074110 [Dallia pectoralis]|uniref:Uncharacterized protein n=1 Tax=Dallia pectoralis TaxID=75939 RepID=A0ACC2H303_DALPE|nr:hypothetical protein DPEC_G00074110 [Dallia pectoralis]
MLGSGWLSSLNPCHVFSSDKSGNRKPCGGRKEECLSCLEGVLLFDVGLVAPAGSCWCKLGGHDSGRFFYLLFSPLLPLGGPESLEKHKRCVEDYSHLGVGDFLYVSPQEERTGQPACCVDSENHAFPGRMIQRTLSFRYPDPESLPEGHDAQYPGQCLPHVRERCPGPEYVAQADT